MSNVSQPADNGLAGLCEASREAVLELKEQSAGLFSACPLCGRAADEHPSQPES